MLAEQARKPAARSILGHVKVVVGLPIAFEPQAALCAGTVALPACSKDVESEQTAIEYAGLGHAE